MKKLKDSDILFSWFANPWLGLLLPMIPSHIKIVIVAGGYDVANCRTLKHGARFKPVVARLTRSLLNKADLVLPVSEFARSELESMAAPKKVVTIFNAVDCPENTNTEDNVKLPIVLTVGAIQKNISLIKGHYRFLEVARQLPGVTFILAGKPIDRTICKLKQIAPPNVKFPEYESRIQLLELMTKASLYLQLSYYESFAISVAEAMAHGCFPVVSRGTAMEEIIQGCGIVVDGEDIHGTARSIKELLAQPVPHRNFCREIAASYSVERRESTLVQAIKENI